MATNGAGNETVRLSPSIAKILLDKSPKHAWLAHRLLGGQGKKPSAAQVKGSAVDAMVFGGTVPKLTAAAQEEAEAIAGSIKDALQSRGIVGTPQYRIEWNSDGTDCSGVVDLFNYNEGRFWELKTSHDLSDYNIVKQIEQYRYDLQIAAYIEGLNAHEPNFDLDAEGTFIFAETSPPYDVRFVSVTPRMLERGKADWREAVSRWSQCMKSNHWPGRGDFTADVSAWRQKQAAEEWLKDSGIE